MRSRIPACPCQVRTGAHLTEPERIQRSDGGTYPFVCEQRRTIERLRQRVEHLQRELERSRAENPPPPDRSER